MHIRFVQDIMRGGCHTMERKDHQCDGLQRTTVMSVRGHVKHHNVAGSVAPVEGAHPVETGLQSW